MEYSRSFGSRFPNELIPAGTKKDIDNTVEHLVSRYYSLLDSGDASAALALYQEHKQELDDYLIHAAYVNRLEEEIYNIGLNVLKREKTVVSELMPIEQPDDSYWYQDYGSGILSAGGEGEVIWN